MSNQKASPANQLYLPFDSLSLGEERGKLYQNKEWLYQKYVIEQLSFCEIARLCNVHASTIETWINRFNIKTRSIGEGIKIAREKKYWHAGTCKISPEKLKKYRNKDWLYKKYWIEDLNSVQIAEIVGVKSNTIMHWIRKFDIKIKQKGENPNWKKRKRIKRICENCGKEFEARPCELKGEHKRRFCKQVCRKAFMIGKNASRPRERFIVICEECGKKTGAHRYKKDTKRFCSQKCMVLWRARTWIGENHPAWRPDTWKTYICEFCKKEYKGLASVENRTHYCSKKCTIAGNVGEKASNWRGGIQFEPYGPEFNAALRKQLR